MPHDDTTHLLHFMMLRFLRHFQGRLYGVGSLFYIVRIDDHGAEQFLRCAGKLAENENTVVLITRSNKFLCDEIHSVMKGTYHAEVGRSVKWHDLFVAMMFFQK